MALKYKLLSQLKQSLKLLKHRKEMILKYVNQNSEWAGKNHYSMEMIPEIEFQIEEMEAAINGIEMLKHQKIWEKVLEKRKGCCGRCVDGVDECILNQ